MLIDNCGTIDIKDLDEANSKLRFKSLYGGKETGDTVACFLFESKHYCTISFSVTKIISVEELFSRYVKWRLTQ